MTNKKYLWIILAVILVAALVAGYFLFLKKPTVKTPEVVNNTGKKVYVNYIGTYENGVMFDTNIKDVAEKNGIYNKQADMSQGKYKPLEFVVGQPGMITGFDNAVRDMKVGDRKKVTIQPKDAYGEYNSGLITTMPRLQFQDANIVPQVGQTYNDANGAFTILAITDKDVKIDRNSQMAGKVLVFEITMERIDNPQNVQ